MIRQVNVSVDHRDYHHIKMKVRNIKNNLHHFILYIPEARTKMDTHVTMTLLKTVVFSNIM